MHTTEVCSMYTRLETTCVQTFPDAGLSDPVQSIFETQQKSKAILRLAKLTIRVNTLLYAQNQGSKEHEYGQIPFSS